MKNSICNKFDNLDEMSQFLAKHKLSKCIFNGPITIKVMELII